MVHSGPPPRKLFSLQPGPERRIGRQVGGYVHHIRQLYVHGLFYKPDLACLCNKRTGLRQARAYIRIVDMDVSHGLMTWEIHEMNVLKKQLIMEGDVMRI